MDSPESARDPPPHAAHEEQPEEKGGLEENAPSSENSNVLHTGTNELENRSQGAVDNGFGSPTLDQIKELEEMQSAPGCGQQRGSPLSDENQGRPDQEIELSPPPAVPGGTETADHNHKRVGSDVIQRPPGPNQQEGEGPTGLHGLHSAVQQNHEEEQDETNPGFVRNSRQQESAPVRQPFRNPRSHILQCSENIRKRIEERSGVGEPALGLASRSSCTLTEGGPELSPGDAGCMFRSVVHAIAKSRQCGIHNQATL